jgi:hypothetical protein
MKAPRALRASIRRVSDGRRRCIIPAPRAARNCALRGRTGNLFGRIGNLLRRTGKLFERTGNLFCALTREASSGFTAAAEPGEGGRRQANNPLVQPGVRGLKSIPSWRGQLRGRIYGVLFGGFVLGPRRNIAGVKACRGLLFDRLVISSAVCLWECTDRLVAYRPMSARGH